MDSRDIFQFRFVDRYESKKCLLNFIANDPTNKILWISGSRGTGKTFLIENTLKNIPQTEINLIYYSFGVEENDLQGFLAQLQRLAPIGFLEFLRTNYTSLVDISKQVVSQALKTAGLDVGGFVAAAHDSAKVFVTHNQQQHSATKVVEKYIETVLKQQHLVVVFDHFSSCSKQPIGLFMQLMGEFLESPAIRFVVVTTDEDMAERQDIQTKLLEQFPVIPLLLKPFDEEIYFYEILEDIFEIPEEAKGVVTQIFSVCKGIPVKLQVALTELYRTNAIQLGKEKAKIDFAEMKRLLLKEEVQFRPDAYSIPAQILLRLIIAFNECAGTALLLQAAEFIIEKLFAGLNILSEGLPKELDNLYQLNVICIDLAQGGIVKISNPIIRETLNENIAGDPTSRMFSGALVSFLSQDSLMATDIGLSKEWIVRMTVLHTIKGKVAGWVQTAVDYGQKKYADGFVDEAFEVFSMIQAESDEISSPALLIIADCFFAAGNYISAEQIMLIIQQRKDLNNWAFHFCYSRILNVRLKKKQAIQEAKHAVQCAQSNEERILALNMQQQILVDITGGRPKAKQIFLSLMKHLEKTPEDGPLILPVLKSAVDFYHSTKALKYLDKAKAMAKDNHLELAYILTNEGYWRFRRGQTDMAKSLFIEAANILENIRIHEISYPLNNLANCYMSCGEYDRAVSTLLRAARWNHSGYISFTTRTLLMACYSLTGDKKKSERLADGLLSDIDKNDISDATMLRKIYLNIAIIYQRHGNLDLEERYAEKAYPVSIGTASWYRAYEIALPFLQSIKDPLAHCPKGEEWYWTHGEYEPWLVIFSHD